MPSIDEILSVLPTEWPGMTKDEIAAALGVMPRGMSNRMAKMYGTVERRKLTGRSRMVYEYIRARRPNA